MATTNGTVRLAAMSDIHVSKTGQGALSSAFAHVSERADLLAMCGDLTDYGLPEEARVRQCRPQPRPWPRACRRRP